MYTKVQCFQPKGKGYTLYKTVTYHGRGNQRSKPRRSGSAVGGLLVDLVAYGITRAIFSKRW
ncbi:MAG: hypothetical protein IJA26_07265 [Clostridia bacterium]|nr:hypothetical protein [Clostridia bacterium]